MPALTPRRRRSSPPGRCRACEARPRPVDVGEDLLRQVLGDGTAPREVHDKVLDSAVVEAHGLGEGSVVLDA